jgi:hypothetical protein
MIIYRDNFKGNIRFEVEDAPDAVTGELYGFVAEHYKAD